MDEAGWQMDTIGVHVNWPKKGVLSVTKSYLLKEFCFNTFHQTFQVPKMEGLTYVGCMQGLCKGKPTPQNSFIRLSTCIFGT